MKPGQVTSNSTPDPQKETLPVQIAEEPTLPQQGLGLRGETGVVHLGETSLSGFLQSEDPSTLQQTAE